MFFMGRCAAGPQALAGPHLCLSRGGKGLPSCFTTLFSIHKVWVWVPHFSLEFLLQDGFPETLQFQLPLLWDSDGPSLCLRNCEMTTEETSDLR